MDKKVIFILIGVFAFIIGTQIVVWSNIIGESGIVGIIKGLIIVILSMMVGALVMYFIIEKTSTSKESIKKYMKEPVEKGIIDYNEEKDKNLEKDKKINDLKSRWEITLNTLVGDEYTIYKTIFDNEGKILQKKIIEITGFSNAKVTRVLDALERKNIVERKRCGMSNIVILK